MDDDDDFLQIPTQEDISGTTDDVDSECETPETIIYNPFLYEYNHLTETEIQAEPHEEPLTEPHEEPLTEPHEEPLTEPHEQEQIVNEQIHEDDTEPEQPEVNPLEEMIDELEQGLPQQVSSFLNEIVDTLHNLQPHDDDDTTSDDDFEEPPSPPVRRRRPLMEIRMNARRVVRPPPPILQRGLTITAPETPLSTTSPSHSFSTPLNRGGGFTPGTNLSHSVENIFSRLFQGVGRRGDPFSPGPGLMQDAFTRSLRDIGGVKHVAKKEVIDTLPVADISAITEINGDDVECAICLMKVVDTDSSIQETSMLPCRHPFHKQCIAEWLKDNSKCPVCRYELPYDEISLVTNQVIPEHPSIQPLTTQQENSHETGDDNDGDTTDLPPEHFVNHQTINMLSNRLSSTFGSHTDFPSLFDIFSPSHTQTQTQTHPQPQPQPQGRHTLQTPLPFFFTQNLNLALPLSTLVGTLSMPPPIPPPGQSREETHIASLDDEDEDEQESEERIFSRAQSPEQQEQETETDTPPDGETQPPQSQTQRHIFTFTLPIASNQSEDMELQEAIMRSLRET